MTATLAHRIEIDVALCEVRRDGMPVPAEPLVFDLIVYLSQHADRIVPKDELVEVLWQGRAISDAALSGAVKAARKVLGDNGQAQQMIRTYHRRGFRFVGQASLVGQPGGAATAPGGPLPETTSAPPHIADPRTTDPRSADPSPAAEDVLVRGPASVGRPSAQQGPPQQSAGLISDLAAAEDPSDLLRPVHGKPSVAVLPFQLLGGDSADRVLVDGLSHDITIRLARTRWLFVIARASAALFAEPGQDLSKVGRKLGVRFLLSGAVQTDGRRLRLSAVLTDTFEGREIWADRFDRAHGDVFELQEEIASLVVDAVEREIDLKERQRALLTPIASLDAWGAYHRARHILFRFDLDQYAEAEQLLTSARKADPGNARILAALSFMHWQRGFLGIEGSNREFDRAFAFARESVACDPLDPQGHWVLGRAHLFMQDYDMAAEALQRSLELNPNFAQGQYTRAYSFVLDGPVVKGLEHASAAMRLSPYDPMCFAFLTARGLLLALDGDAEAGAPWTARGVAALHSHSHCLAIAAAVHSVAGMEPEAQAYLAQLQSVHPGYTKETFLSRLPFTPERRATMDALLARLGL